MKKNKIERIIHEDSWSPEAHHIPWEQFKEYAEDRIKHSISNGYSNPMVRYRSYYSEDIQFEIFLTKLEDKESYNKRKLIVEEKQAKERAAKIDKLKKEAKELGLEIK